MTRSKAPAATLVATHPTQIRYARFVGASPDGSTLAVASFGLDRLDAKTGAIAPALEVPQRVVCWEARFTPDGGGLVAGFGDQTLRRWSLDGGEEAWRVETPGIVTRLSLSADGAYALTCTENTRVQRYRLSDGALAGEHQFAKSWAVGAALHPSGALALAGGTDGYLRRLVFEGDDARVADAREGNGWVEQVVASPDGKRFASGGRGKAVLLWDAETGDRERTLEPLGRTITSIAFSPDSRHVCAAGGKGEPLVWSVDGGPPAARIPLKRSVHGVAWLSNTRIAAVYEDREVAIFELP